MLSTLSVKGLLGPIVAAGAGLLLSMPVLADDQADRIKALEKRLERSVQLIEKLSARVAELERNAKGTAPKAEAEAERGATRVDGASGASDTSEIVRLQESVNQISSSLNKREPDTGLPVHGFADAGAGWSGGADPHRLRGFSVGTLDLYLTPQFGDRVKALAEIAFEFERDGKGSADLERLQVGYTVSDALTVWLGRFHTPFGLWNTAYHHGANLQTSIYRPRFVEFEDKGGIIPAHSVGAWGSGKTRLGAGKITYDAYVSNGPSIRERTLDPNTFTDDNNGKMFGFNLGYQPNGALGGLTVGVHGFGSTVSAYTNSDTVLSKTRLRMGGAYFGYDADDWEAIGEYYRFSNADAAAGAGRTSQAWFVHVGRTFGSLTPFVRYEQTALDPLDNYFRSQLAGRSYKRSVVGARYALDSRSSFKLELSHTNESAAALLDESGAFVPFTGGSYRRASFQYSIAF
jgi:hypothetical protein